MSRWAGLSGDGERRETRGHLVNGSWKMAMKGSGEIEIWLERRDRETG